MRRFEAVEGRIQTLIVLTLSFTTAVPVVARALSVDAGFRSNWFYAALALAFIITLIGTMTKVIGELVLINVKHFYNEPWRSYSEEQFKRRVVFWAGEHLEKNTRLVNQKGSIATLLTFVFALEAACMLVWILRNL